MNEKKWYQSLGVWASLAIPLIAVVLPMLGRAELGKFVTEESVGIVEWLTALGVLVGSALAFYGRWRATTKLTT